MNANEVSKRTLSRWSLERVQFLLSHIEDFIDDENEAIKKRARDFATISDLSNVENLVDCDPNDPKVPLRVLEKLALFFDSGFLLQRGPAVDQANWWVTDLFWRGILFHLELNDQVQANTLVPEIPPLKVQRARAEQILERVQLQFLAPQEGSLAYLLKPTPTLAYVLISNMAAPWSVDHLTHTQRLLNKCFLY
jgi:hypothetical protein